MRSILKTSILLVLFLYTPCFCQDAWHMELIGKAMYDGRLTNFYPYDNHLYIATERLFTVVDITNPGHPHRINAVYDGNLIKDFLVIDNSLYMSTGGGGIVIYDVQNPSAPDEIVRFEENRGFGTMKRFNNYIASRLYSTINIIDIQDLLNPEIVCEISTSYPILIYDFDFYGNYLLLTEGGHMPFNGSYLEIYDISDVANPIQVYDTCLDSLLDLYLQLKVIDNYFYLHGGFDGIIIYDITDPLEPQLIDTTFEEYMFIDFELNDNNLFAGTFPSSIITIDISEPVSPVITNEYTTQSNPRNLCLSEDNLYFSSSPGAITFLDISNPDSPSLDGRYVPGSILWGVAKWGNYTYTAANGFSVVDIADPTDPVGINFFYYDQGSRNIYIDNGILYLANNYNGVLIFSLDDPLNPEFLSSIFTESNVMDMYPLENFLYIANYSDGFRIADISDPTNPFIIGHYPPNNYNNLYMSIIAYGNYAYTAERYDGICVYDISDPSHPVQVVCYDNANYPHDFYIRDNILYVADWGNGLLILDISDPANPAFMGLGECATPFGVWVDGNIAYIADREFGLKAFDISDPYSPELTGTYDDYGWCNNVYVQNDTVYAASGSDGLWILRYDESIGFEDLSEKPERFIYIQNYPNPFNVSTILNYNLTEKGFVKIQIYNLLGQQVATLFNGTRQAGEYRITWNATNFPSGIYFARLETSKQTETIKMVLLK